LRPPSVPPLRRHCAAARCLHAASCPQANDGLSNTFYFFGGWCAICALWAFFFVPETSGEGGAPPGARRHPVYAMCTGGEGVVAHRVVAHTTAPPPSRRSVTHQRRRWSLPTATTAGKTLEEMDAFLRGDARGGAAWLRRLLSAVHGPRPHKEPPAPPTPPTPPSPALELSAVVCKGDAGGDASPLSPPQ
jgi:hypothetical protein